MNLGNRKGQDFFLCTFNFMYQFWFLGLTIIIFTKITLCNIIFKIRINFIIYIEGSMGIFII